MVKRRAADLNIAAVFSGLSRRLGGERGDDLFVGQEDNVGFLLDLVNRTVEKGESNSILVLGPHGVGKSALGEFLLFYLVSRTFILFLGKNNKIK